MSRYLKTLFPITLVLLLVAALFSFRGEAQQPSSKSASGSSPKLTPISGVAVAFAETDAVRDLPDAPVVRSEGVDRGEGEEKNPDNVALGDFRRAIVASKPQTKPIPSLDAALAGYAPSPTLPGGPIITFDGVTANDGITTIGGIVAPSDEQIAVGPKDVVQVTNTGFRVYEKSGNPRIPPKAISKLFGKLGGVCAQFNSGDPIVQYDRAASRWVISQFNFASSNAAPFFECIAVSKTTDPTGSYYAYAFQTPTGTTDNINFPDYPKLATWIDGYYMTVNQFDRSKPAGSQFNGTGFYAFNRAKMLVGDPTANFIYFNLNLATNPEGVASVQPADIDGFTLPAVGQPCPFAYELSDEYEIPPFNVDAIRMFDFRADFATPANSTFTERPESRIPLAPYDPRMPEFQSGTRAECEQPPPAVNADSLNALSYRVMYRLQYRRLGNNEYLTGVFTVNVSGADPVNAAAYQAAPRYFQLRKTSAAGPYSVFDQGTFSPDAGNGAAGTNRFMPSAAIDNQGNLAVSYSTSSTTVFPSINYAGRDFNAAGIPNAGLSAETLLFAGTGVQIGTANRWGDYQSLMVDPADDCTFWTTNQYYNTNNVAFNWRTRIGSFKFPTCTPPDQGTISGTITSCETGAPISGALIQFNNRFSTTSGPDGKYTVQLASGGIQTQTNYTMTVSHPSRLCAPSGPFTVPVAKDGTAVQDVCLSGTANPVLDTTDPTAVVVSGGNGDGKIGPNECDTMSVRLTNTGCATAKNLSATLTSNTPGVTVVAPGSVPYPEVVIDGASFNSVPFRISIDPTVQCGTASFTLTTTFNGGTTTTSFTLPTACGTAPDQTASGNLETADPATPGNGRLGRNAVVSTCSGKACPGSLNATNNRYDVVGPFTNTGPAAACATITLTSANGVQLIAASYNGAFNPANFCTNYAGDPGGSANGSVSWQQTVPAGASINVVIWEVTANQASTANGGAGTPYTVTVSGFTAPAPQGSGPCAAVLTTQVSAATVTLGQSISDSATLTTGGNPTGTITFRLYGPNDNTCAGTPVFTSVVGVNGNSTYFSQPFTPTAAGVYRWIASYSGDGNNPAASGACNDPNEQTTVNPLPTPTATPTPTPTPSPTQLQNVSTRARVEAGSGNEVIGGFIITGSAPKRVIIRGLGPSLQNQGLSDFLINPTLELHPPSGPVVFNQDWRDTQEAEIQATGIPPLYDVESAIVATLAPGNYTAILDGLGTGVGLGLIEIYDLSSSVPSQLANLSTRASVRTGNNVMIGGFLVGSGSGGGTRVVVRALGPSLASAGVTNPLQDPTLELRNSDGTLLLSNDDWQDNSAQAAEIAAAGLAPSNPDESALVRFLTPGAYTAIVQPRNGTVEGVGLVEIYNIK